MQHQSTITILGVSDLIAKLKKWNSLYKVIACFVCIANYFRLYKDSIKRSDNNCCLKIACGSTTIVPFMSMYYLWNYQKRGFITAWRIRVCGGRISKIQTFNPLQFRVNALNLKLPANFDLRITRVATVTSLCNHSNFLIQIL
jgi:ferredoxin-like protein FixX